jgi:succinyl-CoA synthetase beta subunit
VSNAPNRENVLLRLHEHEGKQRLETAGVAVPRGELAADPQAAVAAARRLGGQVVLKAQVLAGGRGRDGGVQQAADPAEAGRRAAEMLARPCRGIVPEQILVEECLSIRSELYAAVTIDPEHGCPLLLLGSGGIDVEDRAHGGQAPRRVEVSPTAGPTATQRTALTTAAGLTGRLGGQVARCLEQLWQVFADHQALTVEVNPLAVLTKDTLVAADAVIELDDAALVAAGETVRPDDDRRERDGGMTFVPLDGDVGVVCSGAGLGMATMDLIGERARPANFLETGGGISRELMRKAMGRVLACPGLRGVIINVYGGINPIHEGALGVADLMADVRVPVVAKALGNHQTETWEILEAAGVHVVREVATEQAVAALLERIEHREIVP